MQTFYMFDEDLLYLFHTTQVVIYSLFKYGLEDRTWFLGYDILCSIYDMIRNP